MAKSGTQPVTGDPMKLVSAPIVLVSVLLVAPTYSQDVKLSEAKAVEPFEPLAIRHSDADELVVIHLDTGEKCPPRRVKRIDSFSIFVPVTGRYLVQVGQKFGVVVVSENLTADEPANPDPPDAVVVEEPEQIAAPAPNDVGLIQVWAFMGQNCAPCDDWKRSELAKLQGMPNVKVYVIPPGQHDKQYTPTFIVSGNGRALEAKGYAPDVNTAERLMALVEGSDMVAK